MLGKLFFIAKMDHNNNYINEKIDFAKSVLEHNLSLINLADTKAGILLGINGVVLALLFGIEKETPTGLSTLFFFLTAILFGVSSIFAISTLIPRLTREQNKTKIYFLKIKESTRKEYIQSWNGLTNDEILTDYILNIYNLASLLTEKYRDLRLSIIITMMAFGFLIAILFF
jgi:pycsar effector protein